MLELLTNNLDIIAQGFIRTFQSSVLALILSLIIGILMGVFQVTNNTILRRIGVIYVEFFKNIPLLVIVMFFYVAVPMYFFPIDGFMSGTIGLTIYTSAFIAETIRAGIQSVPKGQMEAGLSTGLSYYETMWYIVLPQAVKIVIPPLGNQFINLVKNSSVLAIVAGLDLMYAGDLIASTTFRTFDTYMLIGILYLFITMPLTYLMNYLEARLQVKG